MHRVNVVMSARTKKTQNLESLGTQARRFKSQRKHTTTDKKMLRYKISTHKQYRERTCEQPNALSWEVNQGHHKSH